MYHLTPANLVGTRFPANTFSGVKVALVGYCPGPEVLHQYQPRSVAGQPFTHVAPASVKLLTVGSHTVLSLEHVYGGPVSSTVAEELAFYGIDFILAYGLAGGLGVAGCGMGERYLVQDSWVADGTTPHYTSEPVVSADRALCHLVASLWEKSQRAGLARARAATGDAIYREDDALLQGFRDQGCDIVNLDSAHLYAAARINSAGRSVATLQCGVISDVISTSEGGGATSALADMLAEEEVGKVNPMRRVGEMVSFYLETVVPALRGDPTTIS